MSAQTERLAELYTAYNARELETVIGQLAPEVDWPNAWEGGRVHGRDRVRDYWTRQWAEIDPTVEPQGFTELPDGTIAVEVLQTVRSLDGTLLAESNVRHVYGFEGGLVSRMDIEDDVD